MIQLLKLSMLLIQLMKINTYEHAFDPVVEVELYLWAHFDPVVEIVYYLWAHFLIQLLKLSITYKHAFDPVVEVEH